MALGLNYINYTDLTAEQQNFYVRTLLERLVPATPHADYGQKTTVPKNGGLGLEWRKIAALSAATTALTEGTFPAESSYSISQVLGSLSQYGAYIAGTDRILDAGKDKVLLECADLLGEQMALTIDTLTKNVLAAATTVQVAGGLTNTTLMSSTDHYLTGAEIRIAVRTLKRNNARPIGGRFIAIIHPDAWADLMADSAIYNAIQYTQNDNLFTGEAPEWMGVRFIESSNASVNFTTGQSLCAIYDTIVLGSNAYGTVDLSGANVDYIYSPPGSAGTSDPLKTRWTAAWKTLYGCRILSEDSLVRIQHTSSYRNYGAQ
jgi:N4-gp56 family major capsid protein